MENNTGNTKMTTACDSESTETTVMQLPNVIWQVIFDLLPRKDLVDLRFVNKKLRDNIDEIATFNVDFFDHLQPSTLDRIFSLRIRSCTFHRLKESFEPRFKSPLLVKDITFTNVSSENLIKILSMCTHLEKLRFFSTIAMDKHFEPDTDYSKVLQLRNLKTIEVVIHSFGRRNVTAKCSTFDTLFVKNLSILLHFDALENLKISFSMAPEEWIQLFNFILRHSGTLKSLNLRCICIENECNRSDFSEVNLIQLRKQLNLKSLIICCDSGCHPSHESTLHSVFDSIAMGQKSLETVILKYAGLQYSLLVNVLANCKDTVRSVSFRGVQSGFAEVCDGSVIGNCSVLEKFVLDFVEKTYIAVLPSESESEENRIYKQVCTAVTEFDLPKTLKSLAWHGLWIKTCELKATLLENSDCPMGLTNLEFYCIGHNDEFGLNTELFLQICEKFTELEVIKIGRPSFCCLEVGEVDKWNTMVEFAVTQGICQCQEEPEFADISDMFVFRFSNLNKKEAFLRYISTMETKLVLTAKCEKIWEPDLPVVVDISRAPSSSKS